MRLLERPGPAPPDHEACMSAQDIAVETVHAPPVAPDAAALRQRIDALGEWFHNMDLGGVRTNPHHFLGDYPNVKWKHSSRALPADLNGATVLDIGCNGGFYSIAMKRRGAGRVLGVDVCDQY